MSAEQQAVTAALAPIATPQLETSEAPEFWRAVLAQVRVPPITIRLGTLPTGLDEALDLVAHHLDENVEDWLAVNVAGGVVRWSGTARTERIRLLRAAAAQREMPLTIERAPWAIRSAVGHYGAYREGVGRLIGSLHRSLDAGVFVVPLSEPA